MALFLNFYNSIHKVYCCYSSINNILSHQVYQVVIMVRGLPISEKIINTLGSSLQKFNLQTKGLILKTA